MPLASTKDILRSCHRSKCGVGAFNINGLDEPRAIVAAAQRINVPVAITVPGFAERFVALEDVASVTRHASREASVPVALHLSHAADLEQIERACCAGFTSVMFDGSTLSYEENIQQTAEAVRLVDGRCNVEGELGSISSSWVKAEETFTDPERAAEYVQKTGVDILAVSVGNAHGIYHGIPKLNFETIQAIENRTTPLDCYLTLHGGSGIPDDDMRRAIACGITKICIYTEMCIEAKNHVVSYLKHTPNYSGNDDLPNLFQAATIGIVQIAERYMKAFK